MLVIVLVILLHSYNTSKVQIDVNTVCQ